MRNDLDKGAHSVYSLRYHLIWCVKYRRKLLTNEIGDRLKAMLEEIATKADCRIEAVETDTDHVHVLLRAKPTQQLPRLVQRMKGATAFRLFREYPHLRRRMWRGHLWSPSYFAASVGTEKEVIAKYIEGQRQKKR